LIAQHNLYVACQMDDDIPYLVGCAGEDNLVIGTDYGHLDIGSDLCAHSIASQRPDREPQAACKIVDRNARVLFGIDPSFNPAPAPNLVGFGG
jgi:hypothetical protein